MYSGEKRQKIWFSYNFFVPLQGLCKHKRHEKDVYCWPMRN